MSEISAAHIKCEPAPTPFSILVIDDDPITHQLIYSFIGTRYQVWECNTVQEAITNYLKIRPDLVFLDIELGDKEFNGFDVAQTICMYDNEATIVMLTAHENPQNIARTARSGAIGFLVKPFGASRILSYVEDCERYKLERLNNK